MSAEIKGSIPALITPFAGGEVDWEALERLVERQISEGSHGLVPVGTTGESPTLSHEEHEQVVARVVEIARGRVPVIAGAGSNNTIESIRLAQFAEKAGADAVLTVAPYYNRPTQDGLYAHFKAIHDAIFNVLSNSHKRANRSHTNNHSNHRQKCSYFVLKSIH